MASLLSLLNRLLPFATPGTPLLQDLLHLAVICAALYYAPQIQDVLQQRQVIRQADDDQAPAEEQLLPQDTIINENEHVQDDAAFHAEDEAIPQPIPVDDEPQPDQFNDEFNNAQPGPANARDLPTQRNVGAKKAKSLARRDQRRAYNEFMRTQGEAQRARDAEGAAEREKVQAAERERRRAAEAVLEAKKAREREKRREVEMREREEEIARREAVVTIVRRELDERRMCNLFDVAKEVGGDADEVWVEKILKASGLLDGEEGVSVTMVTSTGWVVRVGADDMAEVYAGAETSGIVGRDGVVTFEALGGLLERTLRAR